MNWLRSMQGAGAKVDVISLQGDSGVIRALEMAVRFGRIFILTDVTSISMFLMPLVSQYLLNMYLKMDAELFGFLDLKGLQGHG
jgi:hypothetical protein